MQSFTANAAARRFSEVLNAAQEGPVLVTWHGRNRAVVISMEQFRSYEGIIEQVVNDRLAASLERAIDKFASGQGDTGRRILENLNGLWRSAGIIRR